MSAPAQAVHKHVEHCMGTVFSFHLVAAVDEQAAVTAALADAVAWLRWVDATFSTYQPGSVISRLGRGELGIEQCPAAVGEVLAACEQVQAASNGYFSAYASGTLDPSGYVKGWAIERASDLLVRHGYGDHMINGGGDIQCRGSDAAGQPWRLGIVDPADGTAVIAVVSGNDVALATSGNAERGEHIVDPRPSAGQPGEPGRPGPLAVRSVSIYGRHLALADAYATAAFAMGPDGPAWVRTLPGYEGYFHPPAAG